MLREYSKFVVRLKQNYFGLVLQTSLYSCMLQNETLGNIKQVLVHQTHSLEHKKPFARYDCIEEGTSLDWVVPRSHKAVLAIWIILNFKQWSKICEWNVNWKLDWIKIDWEIDFQRWVHCRLCSIDLELSVNGQYKVKLVVKAQTKNKMYRA